MFKDLLNIAKTVIEVAITLIDKVVKEASD